MTEEPLSMSCSAGSSDESLSDIPLVYGAPAARVVVDAFITDKRWLDKLPGLEALAGEAARDAFMAGRGSRCSGGSGVATVEIALTFGDDEFVRGLNAEHRDIDKPTNVLSFPAVSAEEIEQFHAVESGGDGPAPDLLLGDVVLAFETIFQEAEGQGKRFADHVAHLVAHGVLHLLGFDHARDDEARRMEELEASILENLGIGDPYLPPGNEVQR